MPEENNIFDEEYVQDSGTEPLPEIKKDVSETSDETNSPSLNSYLSKPKRRIIRGQIFRDQD